MDRYLAGFIAVALVLGITTHLHHGAIRLYMAPEKWHYVDKREDPGRFWIFVAVELFLLAAVLIQGIIAAN